MSNSALLFVNISNEAIAFEKQDRQEWQEAYAQGLKNLYKGRERRKIRQKAYKWDKLVHFVGFVFGMAVLFAMCINWDMMI